MDFKCAKSTSEKAALPSIGTGFYWDFFFAEYAGIAFVSLIHDILYCAILFIFYVYLNNSIQLILIIQFYGVGFYFINC